MRHLTPADAVVALEGLPRRFRGLFAGLEADESPDDLAHRAGAEGRSASDHIVDATHTLALLGRALQQVLVEDEPVLHPAAGDASQRHWDAPSGPVEDRLAELATAAAELAEAVRHVPAADWNRTGHVAGGGPELTALDLLGEAVDAAVRSLRDAGRTIDALRGR